MQFLLISSIFAGAQTDRQLQTTQYVLESVTPNTSNSYIWTDESDNRQGVYIDLASTEVVNIYVEKGNALIRFGNFKTANVTWPLIYYFEYNLNNQGYVKIHEGSGKVSILLGSTSIFNSIGTYNLKIKFNDGSSSIYHREYNICVVEKSDDFYEDNYRNSLRVWKSGSLNSTPLLLSEGFDAYNIKPQQYYRYAGSDLFDDLLDEGFDIYVINYKYNAQDIRNSTAIYTSAIKYISLINNNSKIVASGMSMGGVISRYALAKAEDGNVFLPVSKWVSMDAPQQGAVVSKELQDFRKENTSSDFEEYASDNTAAKQLLTYNSYDPSGNTHNAFYNELNSLNNDGYPHKTHNIGIAFSNTAPNPNTGKWLFVDVKIGSSQDKSFYLSAEEKVAGSYLPQVNIDPYVVSIAWGIFWTSVSVTQYTNPTFIPYVSALDVVNGNSKFHQTIVPSANYHGFHDVIPQEIIPQIVRAIKYDYNTFVQDEVISIQTEYNTLNNIYAGNNIKPDFPTGNVIIKNGANVIYTDLKVNFWL
jgi:hypothetical protein